MVLKAHYPLQEDSGDAQDATGNGNAGTVNGATQGASGILGATAYSFGGAGDYVDIGNFGFGSGASLSLSLWYKLASSDTDADTMLGRYDGSDDVLQLQVRPSGENDVTRAQLGHVGGNYHLIDGYQNPTGTWTHAAVVFDSTTPKTELYVNGASQGEDTSAVADFTQSDNIRVGSRSDASAHFDGDIAGVRLYDHALTPGEVQHLYDVGLTGTILTATKTHGSSISPDLRADVTLNSQSATGYVIGSPGTASEESQSASLSNGSNDYTLTWNNSHTDFRVQVVADISDVTSRVEVNRLALLA